MSNYHKTVSLHGPVSDAHHRQTASETVCFHSLWNTFHVVTGPLRFPLPSPLFSAKSTLALFFITANWLRAAVDYPMEKCLFARLLAPGQSVAGLEFLFFCLD